MSSMLLIEMLGHKELLLHVSFLSFLPKVEVHHHDSVGMGNSLYGAEYLITQVTRI